MKLTQKQLRMLVENTINEERFKNKSLGNLVGKATAISLNLKLNEELENKVARMILDMYDENRVNFSGTISDHAEEAVNEIKNSMHANLDQFVGKVIDRLQEKWS